MGAGHYLPPSPGLGRGGGLSASPHPLRCSQPRSASDRPLCRFSPPGSRPSPAASKLLCPQIPPHSRQAPPRPRPDPRPEPEAHERGEAHTHTVTPPGLAVHASLRPWPAACPWFLSPITACIWAGSGTCRVGRWLNHEVRSAREEGDDRGSHRGHPASASPPGPLRPGICDPTRKRKTPGSRPRRASSRPVPSEVREQLWTLLPRTVPGPSELTCICNTGEGLEPRRPEGPQLKNRGSVSAWGYTAVPLKTG